VGPRALLDYAEKRKFLALPGLELQLLGLPACSQSLYECDILAHQYVISKKSKK
jgi:hypothetical protein